MTGDGPLADPSTGTRTIVFTDLVGSTAMRSTLGDAAADDVRRQHDAVLRAAVEHHDGVVAKGLGDGVMAVFESAARAATAAVAMQQGITELATELGVDVAIRVGMSAGDVLAEEGDWFGTPVVEAARLEAAADRGQILASELVRKLAGSRERIAFDAIGPLELKGLGAPISACAVRWEPRPPAPAPTSGAVVHPPPLAPSPPGTNLLVLAAPGGELVGRDHELAEVATTLDGPCRLVTLTGPGGVGKTTLAGAAAGEAVAGGGFPDGVHVVELAAVGADQVVNAVASALDVREAPGLDLETSVAEHLRDRRVLLVLDNCEHVVEAAAHLVHVLLRAAPRLVVLATSQVPLGTAEEVVHAVQPLPVPSPEASDPDVVNDFAAVQLFVDRARRTNRTFSLTDQSAAAVAQICRRLDGIPLAIELAAARIRALSANQIATRLDDRFGLLTAGNRTDDERHQTLLAAVEWSYSLLSEGERRVLARVASFPGGFDLGTAEQVAADGGEGVSREEVLDLIATLVDKSLLTTVDRPDGELRYRLLETIRAYAADQLDDLDFERTTERILRWAVELAEAVEDEIDTPGEDEAMARVAAERENLLFAIRLAEEAGEAESAMTIAAVLAVWLDVVGHFGEGIALCEDVLAWTSDVQHVSQRQLILRAGNLALSSGRLERAHRFYEESLEQARALGEPQGVLSALNNLAITAMWRGDFAQARALLDEAEVSDATPQGTVAILQVTKAELALHTNQLDEAFGLLDEVAGMSDAVGSYTMAEVDVLRGYAHYADERMAEASEGFAAALEHAATADAVEFSALARHGLGLVALRAGDLDRARALLEPALDEARAAEHARAIAQLQASLSLLDAAGGDLVSARRCLRESVRLRVGMGDRFGLAENLDAEARWRTSAGEPGALRLHGAAAALREQTGPLWPVDRRPLEADVAALRDALGADGEAAWDEGRALAGPDRPLADVAGDLLGS